MATLLIDLVNEAGSVSSIFARSARAVAIIGVIVYSLVFAFRLFMVEVLHNEPPSLTVRKMAHLENLDY